MLQFLVILKLVILKFLLIFLNFLLVFPMFILKFINFMLQLLLFTVVCLFLLLQIQFQWLINLRVSIIFLLLIIKFLINFTQILNQSLILQEVSSPLFHPNYLIHEFHLHINQNHLQLLALNFILGFNHFKFQD